MQQRSDDTRVTVNARGLTEQTVLRLQTFALYGSLVLIAAVVFGSLGIHPF
ncbi:hypothetical protein [Nitrobacter winogradskyi]|uniref:Uncharacterized protein n=2 Tax=Nitrobacter winogradskyi TaxID=913 RepID=A0ACC6AGQ4_NITWI|nr:hypothetical protein [Nitrobacter winogradskyi]MCP1998461.1 hypothetical protein [Nitrobacter winogradskyi]GEC16692.1 hypothetical protein NWI01_25840 [Nitrobacter winogradskyi]